MAPSDIFTDIKVQIYYNMHTKEYNEIGGFGKSAEIIEKTSALGNNRVERGTFRPVSSRAQLSIQTYYF